MMEAVSIDGIPAKAVTQIFSTIVLSSFELIDRQGRPVVFS